VQAFLPTIRHFEGERAQMTAKIQGRPDHLPLGRFGKISHGRFLLHSEF
jgi:hypothetical protein